MDLKQRKLMIKLHAKSLGMSIEVNTQIQHNKKKQVLQIIYHFFSEHIALKVYSGFRTICNIFLCSNGVSVLQDSTGKWDRPEWKDGFVFFYFLILNSLSYHILSPASIVTISMSHCLLPHNVISASAIATFSENYWIFIFHLSLCKLLYNFGGLIKLSIKNEILKE